jgi:nucleoside phosphorylase/CheY-like chemotaxis protein
MKILLVDDDDQKISSISDALCDFPGISSSDIDVVKHSQAARDKLSQSIYDLMILDINLPPDGESSPEKHEGINFLKFLKLDSKANLPLYILGVTGYEDILQESKGAFALDSWSVIKFDILDQEWKKQLKNKIDYISKLNSWKPSTQEFDICIVTAVDAEFKAVFSWPIEWTRFTLVNDPSIYYRSVIIKDGKTTSVVLSKALRMGMVASAVLVSKMIMHFNPNYIFMVGICAGLEGKLSLGDIVVADPAWGYESGKQTTDGFKPSPHQVHLDARVRADLLDHELHRTYLDKIKENWPKNKTLQPTQQINMRVAPMGSGSAVVAVDDGMAPLQDQHRGVLALEMEAYAVMSTAETISNSKPFALVIKSICDFASSEKGDDYQEYAAYTSAEFTFKYITESLSI